MYLNVVGYVRISKDEDKENYGSIINQKKIITDFAKLNNYSLQKIYEDDNVSGYTFDRPELNNMIRDMEENKFDVIIAKDLSRIGRHNALTLLFIEQVRRLDKRLILIDEGNGGYDSSKDNDDIIGIKTWYNELYVKDISRKIKSHLKIKQKEGKLIIRDYFGYRKNTAPAGSTLVIDEDVAHIVRQIFILYIQGNGYRKVAQILNDKKYPTPSQIIKLTYEKEGKVYKGNVSAEWNATLYKGY
jgi:DNA invertase Pin-like site-specific DNA recombinase